MPSHKMANSDLMGILKMGSVGATMRGRQALPGNQAFEPSQVACSFLLYG